MKRFIQRISLPVLLFAGLMLIGTQTADAGPSHGHARRSYAHRHYYAAPAVRVYAPPVRVYTPSVRVYVPSVPSFRVYVGPWVPSHYGHSPYYYRW